MERRHWFAVGLAVAVALGGLLVAWLSDGGTPPTLALGTAAAGPDAGSTRAQGSAQLEALRRRAQGAADAGELPAARVDGQGQVVARFGWGGGDGNLGRERPQEGNPEAPMAVALDAQGSAWVLDQVNQRLVKVGKDGKVQQSVPLTMQGPQDLAVGRDGTVAVMDRLLDKTVTLFGPDGKPLGELPVEGKNLEEGGVATGVFVDGEDVYVEREHGDVVRVGDTKGQADPQREEMPGRPARDGKTFLTASISSPADGRVAVTAVDRPSLAHRFTRELRLGLETHALNLLDTDLAGIIYLGAVVVVPTPGGEAVPKVWLLCLDPRDGMPLGRAELPANTSADETMRELTVLDEGGVVYLYRTEEGASLQRWDCR